MTQGAFPTPEERDAWIVEGIKNDLVLLGAGIIPDWRQTWTSAQAEEQMPGFTFTGPGWYIHKENVVIVVPQARARREMWHHAKAYEDEPFEFLVYIGRNPSNIFEAIQNAPSRQDDRSKRPGIH